MTSRLCLFPHLLPTGWGTAAILDQEAEAQQFQLSGWQSNKVKDAGHWQSGGSISAPGCLSLECLREREIKLYPVQASVPFEFLLEQPELIHSKHLKYYLYLFLPKTLWKRKGDDNQTRARTLFKLIVEGLRTMNTSFSSSSDIWLPQTEERTMKMNKASGGKAKLGHPPWGICPLTSNCLMYKTNLLRVG